MRIEILAKIYDEFVDLTHKYNMDSTEVVEFVLSFLIFNMRTGLDEEDARVFCHSFYRSMIREIELRKRKGPDDPYRKNFKY